MRHAITRAYSARIPGTSIKSYARPDRPALMLKQLLLAIVLRHCYIHSAVLIVICNRDGTLLSVCPKPALTWLDRSEFPIPLAFQPQWPSAIQSACFPARLK